MKARRARLVWSSSVADTTSRSCSRNSWTEVRYSSYPRYTRYTNYTRRPGSPGLPDTPDTPDTPGTADTLNTQDTPGTPDTPGTFIHLQLGKFTSILYTRRIAAPAPQFLAAGKFETCTIWIIY